MEEQKSILIITDLLDAMSGTERHIVELVKNINEKKFKVFLCCLWAGQLAETLQNQGVHVIKMNVLRVYSLHLLKKIPFLLKLIRNEKIRLIVTYHESSDFIGFFLSKIAGIPIISSKRDMGYNLNKRNILIYRLIGRFYNAIITVSNAVKKEVIKRDRVFPSKIFTIYNGVDTNIYDDNLNLKTKQQLGLKNSSAIVGTISGIRKIKGTIYFLESAEIVLRDGWDVNFLIVGHDQCEPGFSRSDMEQFVKKRGLSERVHFLGSRNDIVELLSVIDISVLPSLSEGFSNTIIESMAAGKPVIATNVGGNAESVVDGETGILVPPKDSTALASAIITLLKDKKRIASMGIAARQRVEAKFSLKKMINANESLYNSIIETYKTK